MFWNVSFFLSNKNSLACPFQHFLDYIKGLTPFHKSGPFEVCPKLYQLSIHSRSNPPWGILSSSASMITWLLCSSPEERSWRYTGHHSKGNPPQNSGMEHQLQKPACACQLAVCSPPYKSQAPSPMVYMFKKTPSKTDLVAKVSG